MTPSEYKILDAPRTQHLLSFFETNDDAGFEDAIADLPRMTLSEAMRERIESVVTYASEEDEDYEPLCWLAAFGVTEYVSEVLRKEAELVASGYEW